MTDLLFDLDHAGESHRVMTLADLARAGVPDAIVLPHLKARLRERVDAAAEAQRTAVLTPGTGQALEYQEAQAQAEAALKAPGGATAAKYPMLAASIGLDVDPSTGQPAADVLGVARSVQAAYDAWQALGAAIRGARLAGKAAIGAATTIDGALAAYAAVQWPPAG